MSSSHLLVPTCPSLFLECSCPAPSFMADSCHSGTSLEGPLLSPHPQQPHDSTCFNLLRCACYYLRQTCFSLCSPFPCHLGNGMGVETLSYLAHASSISIANCKYEQMNPFHSWRGTEAEVPRHIQPTQMFAGVWSQASYLQSPWP
jgi:hypothetical protein